MTSDSPNVETHSLARVSREPDRGATGVVVHQLFPVLVFQPHTECRIIYNLSRITGRPVLTGGHR